MFPPPPQCFQQNYNVPQHHHVSSPKPQCIPTTIALFPHHHSHQKKLLECVRDEKGANFKETCGQLFDLLPGQQLNVRQIQTLLFLPRQCLHGKNHRQMTNKKTINKNNSSALPTQFPLFHNPRPSIPTVTNCFPSFLPPCLNSKTQTCITEHTYKHIHVCVCKHTHTQVFIHTIIHMCVIIIKYIYIVPLISEASPTWVRGRLSGTCRTEQTILERGAAP